MFLGTRMLATAAVSLIAIASPASAATLLQYNLANNSGVTQTETPSFVAANLSGNDLTRGSGLTATSASGAFNSSGWSAYTSAAGMNDYLTFGFNIADGYRASVNQLVFGSDRSGTGPGSMSLLASVDGGAFTSLSSFAPGGSRTIDFAALTGTDSIVFRIVSNVNTTNAAGTFRVLNAGSTPFTVAGDVALLPVLPGVPEPATWAMMIGGIGFAGGALRTRRSRTTVRFA